MTPTAIARAGALHLAELVRKNGRFVYAYRLGGDRIGGYNLLRHCGSIWAMADTANTLPGLDPVQKTARRALSWLLNEKTVTVGKGLCLVGRADTTKLGGAALAALACLEMNMKQDEAKLLKKAKAFGRFILMMRLPNGDFVHKVELKQKKALPFRSDYYTGEALFALARLFTETGDPHWRDVAIASVRKLGAVDYGVAVQSHWMLYALAELSRTVDKDFCVHYGRKIVESILDQPDYRARNQSTPTACRSEGMLAFVEMSRDAADPAICAVRQRALAALEENLNQQRLYFHPSGAFVRGQNQDDVRIDFIQHNVSSFLRYSRLFPETEAGTAASSSLRAMTA